MYQCVQCVQCALVFSPVYTSVQISLISFSDGIFFCIKGGPAYSGSSKDGEDRASFIQSARPNEFTFVAFLLFYLKSPVKYLYFQVQLLYYIHYCRSAIVFVIF